MGINLGDYYADDNIKLSDKRIKELVKQYIEEDVIIEIQNSIDYTIMAIGVYGSQNYNMVTETSDFDCVVVVKEKNVKTNVYLENIDCKIISEEIFEVDLLKSGYPIFYEILDCDKFIYSTKEFKEKYINKKSNYLYCNLDRYSACMKMEWYKGYNHLVLGKPLNKGSKHQPLIDKYGYSTKLIQQSFRQINVFRKFDLGIRGKELYIIDDNYKKFLMNVKNNLYTKQELITLLDKDKVDLYKLRDKYRKKG